MTHQNQTIEETFIRDHGEWLDKLAEENDKFGTLQGVIVTTIMLPAYTLDEDKVPVPIRSCTVTGQPVNVIKLVFEHGLIIAQVDDLAVIVKEEMTRI